MKLNWMHWFNHKHKHLVVKFGVAILLMGLAFRLFLSTSNRFSPKLEAPFPEKTADSEQPIAVQFPQNEDHDEIPFPGKETQFPEKETHFPEKTVDSEPPISGLVPEDGDQDQIAPSNGNTWILFNGFLLVFLFLYCMHENLVWRELLLLESFSV